ncbi:MAG: hypothetical protein COT71_04520 [Candidatus Andersenbacteria bacterium CG10_big_fil_rev_8_21_14_0_10_54_11]|uniref:V-type ATP synthase subunit C n=1 Tax=Candidatus Andersenbacteria bacterium CG10_big_fil_rev_8_21_14_0_10_54_11 TaxID=1974485 RepID=A0A2M6WY29_9BACT|nr:MAG: hypothetical protein COT71_04520 [Candidatus Andersenbacteria bacterium CG10_big_fil_rev_8_21_14_0_10_54_11]
MVKVDTPYIIGIIREREKLFFGPDEYMRLLGASSYAAAGATLAETSYGSVAGLTTQLEDTRAWLAGLLLQEQAVLFMSAQADALNAATALVRHRLMADDPGTLSPLGSFSLAALHSTIWHDLGWEALPLLWQSALRRARQQERTVHERIEIAADTLHAWYRSLATTPLTLALTAVWQERRAAEEQVRPLAIKTIGRLSSGEDSHLAAALWDLTWDVRAISVLRRARMGVSGIDPILAFWFAKEMEVKTLRILLAGKLAGLPTADLQQLVRPSHLHYA